MVSRFYTSDQAKWKGRNDFGANIGTEQSGDRLRQIVGKWAYDSEADTTGTLARLEAAYVDAFATVEKTREARQQIESTGKFTRLGIAEKLAEHAAANTLPALRRARAAIESVKKDLSERHAKLALPKPSDDERKAQEEIRSAMRAMTDAQRDAFVRDNRRDPTVMAAIASAPAGLSGVHSKVHENIRAEALKAANPELFGLIDDLSEPIEKAQRATDLGREAIRETLGVDRTTFEQIASVAEAGNGELPFRVDREVIDGKMIEVARVLDMQKKVWRRAEPHEIQAAQAGRAA